MFSSILDKRAKKKIELLTLIMNQTSPYTPYKEIIEELKISSYKLNIYISELNEQLERLGTHGNYPNIEIIEGVIIKINQKRHVNTEVIINDFITNSMGFSMLFIMFTSPGLNLQKFAENYFISVSTAYKTLSKVEENLKIFGVVLDKELNLKGNELSIRYLYFYLFVIGVGNDSYFIETEVKENINKLITSLEKITKKNFRPSEREYMTYFFIIMISRNSNNLLNVERIDIIDKQQQDYHSIFLLFKHFFSAMNLDASHIDEEVTLTVAVMYGLEMLPKDIVDSQKFDLIRFEAEQFRKISLGFLDSEIKKSSINKQHNLKEKLERTFFGALIFAPYDGVFDVPKSELDNLEKKYPKLYESVHLYVFNKIAQPELKRHKNYLLYNLVINVLSEYTEELLPKLNFFLDLSFSHNYIDFIEMKLKSIFDYNITIVRECNDSIDFIITDRPKLYYGFDSERLITWTNPPLSHDYLILEEYLNDYFYKK